MMTFSKLVVAVALGLVCALSQTSKFCPSDAWVECGRQNNKCDIPPSVTAAIVSYGAVSSDMSDPGGMWSFVDVTNIAGQAMSLDCSDHAFGDPYHHQKKGCCYNLKAIVGESTNERNWDFMAVEKQVAFVGQTTMIRFGIAGRYSYRYMLGEFTCDESTFADTYHGKSKNCWAFNNGTVEYPFVECGDEHTGYCNVDTVPGRDIKLVRYGTPPNFFYRYLYTSLKSPDFSCNDKLFGKPDAGNKFCAVANATIFAPGTEGDWYIAASCAGQSCVINQEIEFGVTSTTTESCTKSWTTSLSTTVSGGCKWASVSLTWTESHTVSHTISSSYSQHSTLSCGAVCGNGSSDTWTLYQWRMSAAEYSGADVVPFDINACTYVCSTTEEPPQCPPGYCTPGTMCMNCTGYP